MPLLVEVRLIVQGVPKCIVYNEIMDGLENVLFSLSLSLSHSHSLPPPKIPTAYDYPGSLISSHTPRQRALSEAEDGTRVWHLFKQLDVEDPKRSPFMNKKLVSEIYLPRMLSTKVSSMFVC